MNSMISPKKELCSSHREQEALLNQLREHQRRGNALMNDYYSNSMSDNSADVEENAGETKAAQKKYDEYKVNCTCDQLVKPKKELCPSHKDQETLLSQLHEHQRRGNALMNDYYSNSMSDNSADVKENAEETVAAQKKYDEYKVDCTCDQ